jgi:hypothetical protein
MYSKFTVRLMLLNGNLHGLLKYALHILQVIPFVYDFKWVNQYIKP